MFIIVLGGGIDLKGNLPSLVYQRLNKAIEIYQSLTKSVGLQQIPKPNKNKVKIIVLGKYSFLYHQLKKYPPITEAEKMAEYLLSKNIPKKNILLEKKSKDTIGNAYYLKIKFFLPQKVRSAIIVTSRFHLKRVKYIFKKVFGPNYKLTFIDVEENLPEEKKRQVLLRQEQLLLKTKKILSPMKDGNHLFLKGKLYKLKYYREKRPDWVINFVAQGR